MFFATLTRFFGMILSILEKKDESLLELEKKDRSFWIDKSHLNKVSDDSLAFFPYQDSDIKKAVLEIKARNNHKLLKALCSVAAEILIEELSELKTWNNFNPTLVVAIPPSSRSKGFNQSEEIAKMIISELNSEIRLLKGALVKVRTTPIQHSLPREKRLKNLRRSMEAKYAEKIAGADIIVVDDVTTTGATFEEAARALKEIGARKIFCIALAH
jgi:competence protein ComFC